MWKALRDQNLDLKGQRKYKTLDKTFRNFKNKKLENNKSTKES